MGFPRAMAVAVATVRADLLHWTVHDERIDFRSDSYAVETGEGWVAVDPLPLGDAALASLPPLLAILLTAAPHQRWAWELRRRTGAPVWAPAGGTAFDGEPDHGFRDGDALPGGLIARATPGPKGAHHALLRRDGVRPAAAAVGDLLIAGPQGRLVVLPDAYTGDPAATRTSLQRLAGDGLDVLLPAHAAPVLAGASEALRDAAGASPA